MPYSDVSGLTPNHLLYPRWEHCRVSDAQIPMNSQQYHTKFIAEYQSFCDALEEEFLHVLQSNESRFREAYFARHKQQASHITAQTGDLVTWFEANVRKLGVIETIISHNSCLIRTSRGQRIKRMISSLTPVLCARINRYFIIIDNNNALDHFTVYCQLIFSYANVFQSGFIRVVDFTVFSLFLIATHESFWSCHKTLTISASVLQLSLIHI